jgi:cold shock CspA family protein
MTVDKYIPEGMYGFVTDGDQRLFFHLENFDPGPYEGAHPVPPVAGEDVDVELVGEDNKVERVHRLDTPARVDGVVDWFDSAKGYGFALGTDGRTYFLHRSEVLGGRLPLPGRGVRFYTTDKRRACFVEMVEGKT